MIRHLLKSLLHGDQQQVEVEEVAEVLLLLYVKAKQASLVDGCN
jgi:hypothetical protein